MSIKYMLSAMEAKAGSSARKLVLIKLADNANDNGFCYPSYQNIADHCEMSKRSVMTHINRLECDGFLTKSARKTNNGFTSNGYQLNFLGSENISLGGSENISLGSENISPTGENISLGGSENFSPRTCHSFEPVKEPKEKSNKKEILPDEVLSLADLEKFKPDEVDPVLWLAFLTMRKTRKAMQTTRAVNGQLRELNLCHQHGISKTLAIERFLEERWIGIKFIYFKNMGVSHAASSGFGKESASERNARLSEETTRQHQAAVAEALADGFV